MYVSYDFYKQTFGGAIPEADFSKVEAKAEAVIGYLTYINGDIFAKEDNRVKLAVCAAAEVVHYHNNQASANGNQAAGVKSETNDGYSVTYITEGQDGQTAEELLRKKILEAARVYLLPTGWLSRSLKGGCRHVCADCDLPGEQELRPLYGRSSLPEPRLQVEDPAGSEDPGRPELCPGG